MKTSLNGTHAGILSRIVCRIICLLLVLSVLGGAAHAQVDGGETMYAKVASLYMQEEADDARALIREYYEANKGDLDACVTAAELLWAFDEDPAYILRFTEECLSEFPESADLYLIMSNALSDLFRHAEAVEAANVAIDMETESDDDLYDLYEQYKRYANLYEVAKRAGEFTLAARALEHLLAYEAFGGAFLERVRLRLWYMYTPQLALKDLNAIIKREPDNTDAYYQRMYAHIWLDEYDEALEDARTLAKILEGVADFILGIANMYAGDTDEAREYLTRFTQDNPREVKGFLSRGILYIEHDYDLKAARADFLKVLDLDSKEASALRFLSRLSYIEGDIPGAIRLAEKAADCADDDTAPLLELSLLYIWLGRTDEARETLSRMWKEYPNRFDTLWVDMWVSILTRDFDKALASFAAIETAFPFLAQSHLHVKALLCAAAGRLDETERIIEEKPPESIPDILLCAGAYVYAGNAEHADQYLAAASEKIKEDKEAGNLSPTNYVSYMTELYTVSAEARYISGDMDACIEMLRGACELGWHPQEAVSSLVMSDILDNAEFLKLLDEYPIKLTDDEGDETDGEPTEGVVEEPADDTAGIAVDEIDDDIDVDTDDDAFKETVDETVKDDAGVSNIT